MEHDSPGNINHDLNLDSTKAKQQHKEIERRRRNRMKAYFEEMEQLIPNIIERNRQKKRNWIKSLFYRKRMSTSKNSEAVTMIVKRFTVI